MLLLQLPLLNAVVEFVVVMVDVDVDVDTVGWRRCAVVVPIGLPYPQHQQPQHVAIQQYPNPHSHPPLQQQIQPQQHPVVATATAAGTTTTKNMTGLIPTAAANIGPYSDIIHQEELQAAAQTKAAAADAAVSKAVLTETDHAKISAGSTTTTGTYNATTTDNADEHILNL